MFKNSGFIYSPKDIDFICDNIIKNVRLVSKRDVKYFNIPCAFDIETTSFVQINGIETDKRAIMYEWTLGLNGWVIIGRTWDEFLQTYESMIRKFGTYDQKRIIIYVHNLAFEFQFMRKLFQWQDIFSLDTHKPLYAVTYDGVEFRCSYQLSGYGLAKLGDQLLKYKCKKMVGDLDYSLLRHSKTPLTQQEQKYCENDVRVVMAYIQEKIEQDGNIAKIPYTKTGYVRNYCRNSCLYDNKNYKERDMKVFRNYKNLMSSLTLDVDEYEQLQRGFMGGFTHASFNKVGKVIENVASYDFTSSYPAVMCAEKFPMSKSRTKDIKSKDELDYYLKNYCCLFDVQITGLISKIDYDHPLSTSKCWDKIEEIEDNGRIVEAEELKTTCTELDWETYNIFYKWKKVKIFNFRYYQKAYLPTNFVKAILHLYKTKTELKGVEGKELEYLNSKEMINACYGMMVTDICRSLIVYNDGVWGKIQPDMEKEISKYNKSLKRFLFYPWGIWVTAYARHNLFTGIYAFKQDYIYSDTDSIKATNKEKHIKYIKAYNEYITEKLRKAMNYHKLDFDLTRPKTINGIEKPLGVWDEEKGYDKFKTLGAKRYMIVQDNTLSLTVAGLNKKIAVPYLLDKYKTFDNVLEHFDNELYVPANYTGKNTHTYIEEEKSGIMTDYLGYTSEYHEMSGVHLEAAEYSLNMSDKFINYLKGYKNSNE